MYIDIIHNIQTYIISYHITSYHIISYHITSYHIISYHIYIYHTYIYINKQYTYTNSGYQLWIWSTDFIPAASEVFSAAETLDRTGPCRGNWREPSREAAQGGVIGLTVTYESPNNHHIFGDDPWIPAILSHFGVNPPKYEAGVLIHSITRSPVIQGKSPKLWASGKR